MQVLGKKTQKPFLSASPNAAPLRIICIKAGIMVCYDQNQMFLIKGKISAYMEGHLPHIS